MNIPQTETQGYTQTYIQDIQAEFQPTPTIENANNNNNNLNLYTQNGAPIAPLTTLAPTREYKDEHQQQQQQEQQEQEQEQQFFKVENNHNQHIEANLNTANTHMTEGSNGMDIDNNMNIVKGEECNDTIDMKNERLQEAFLKLNLLRENNMSMYLNQIKLELASVENKKLPISEPHHSDLDSGKTTLNSSNNNHNTNTFHLEEGKKDIDGSQDNKEETTTITNHVIQREEKSHTDNHMIIDNNKDEDDSLKTHENKLFDYVSRPCDKDLNYDLSVADKNKEFLRGEIDTLYEFEVEEAKSIYKEKINQAKEMFLEGMEEKLYDLLTQAAKYGIQLDTLVPYLDSNPSVSSGNVNQNNLNLLYQYRPKSSRIPSRRVGGTIDGKLLLGGGDGQNIHTYNHTNIDDKDLHTTTSSRGRSRYVSHLGEGPGGNSTINNNLGGNIVINSILDNTTKTDKKRKRGLSPASMYLKKTLKRSEIDKDIYKITKDTKWAIDNDGARIQDNEELNELNNNRPEIDLKIERHCFYYNYRVEDDEDDEEDEMNGGGATNTNSPPRNQNEEITETRRGRRVASKYRQEEKESSSSNNKKEKEKTKEKIVSTVPSVPTNPYSEIFGKYTACFKKKTPCWVTQTETDDIFRGFIFSFNHQEIVVKLTNQTVLPDQKTTPHASYYNVSNKLYIPVEDIREGLYLLDEIVTND